MKAKSLTVLGVSALLLLVGCGGSEETSSPSSDIPGSVVVNDDNLQVKDGIIFGQLATGTIGVTTGDNKYAVADATKNKTTAPIIGTIFAHGDGNYIATGASFLRTDAGNVIYLHNAKTPPATLKQDILPGARLKIAADANFEVYNGLPQVTGFTYEVLIAADNSDAQAKAVNDLFAVKTLSDLSDANEKLIPAMALQPILLKDMVLTSPLQEGDSSYFTPLAEVGTVGAKQIAVRRAGLASSFMTKYTKGMLFDIYGGVSAYGGSAQLFITALSETQKIQGLAKKSSENLTPAQIIATNKYATDMGYKDHVVNYEYWKQTSVADTPIILDTALKAIPGTGAQVLWTSSDSAVAEVKQELVIGTTYKTVIEFKKEVSGTELVEKSVTLTRKICTKDVTDCATAVASEKVSIDSFVVKVKHVFVEPRLEAINQSMKNLASKTMVAGWTYITNKENYPDPSTDVKKGIQYNFANGGLVTPKTVDSSTAKVELLLNVIKYTSAQPEPSEYVITLNLLAEDGITVVGTGEIIVDPAEFTATAKDITVKAELALNASAAKFTSIQMLIKNSVKATVYLTNFKATLGA